MVLTLYPQLNCFMLSMFIVANLAKTLKSKKNLPLGNLKNLPHPIHFPTEYFQERNEGSFYMVFVFALPSYEMLHDDSLKQ